jgi:hypothetical protein
MTATKQTNIFSIISSNKSENRLRHCRCFTCLTCNTLHILRREPRRVRQNAQLGR